MTLTKIGASLSGGADLVTITQSTHNFTVGKVLRSSGSDGTYTTAQANTPANAEVIGIVVQVIDANTFTMALSGRITVDGAVPNVTAGTVLFLSDTSAGDLTSTEPTDAGEISKPVAVVTTANSEMLMVNYRGEVISTATESWDTNGAELILDVDGDTSIHANTDDQIDVQISGADDFRFTANSLNVLSGSTLSIDSGATISNSGTLVGFNSNSFTVTQSSHGLAVGNVVKSSGSNGAFAKARANSAANAEVVGVVTVVSGNDVTITTSGEVDVAAAVPDVAAGTVVFLHQDGGSDEGTLTSTEPSATGEISKPIAIVTHQNSKMVLLPFRGEVIGSNTAAIADDAVTNAKLANMAANTVKVRDANASGDPSDKAVADTQILIGDGTGFTAAALSGEATMTNAGVVSITDNIIDEANLKISNSPTNGQFLSAQSGNTGGLTWAAAGGTAVAGTTDNGVLTFVNSGSTFAAESTLTFPFNTSSHGNTNDLGTLTVTGAATFQTGNSWKTGQNPPFYFVNLDPNGGDRSHVMRIRGGANASNSNVLEVQDYGGNSVFTVDGADEVKLRENNSMPSVTKGIAKAWGNFDGDAGTPSYRTSYNMGTLDDDGAGNYGCHFSTAMEDADYVIAGTSQGDATMIVRNVGSALGTAEAKIAVMTHNGGLADRDVVTIVVFGEQT